MLINKKKFNPLLILLTWVIGMIAFTIISVLLSIPGASDGEQRPLTTLATMIVVTFYGAAIISILTPFFYWNWFKKNWWFIFIIILTLIPIVKIIQDYYSQNKFSISETTTEVNGNKIITKLEYYDEFKKVRSESYWKNGKKDSIWKIYSEDGKIIKEQFYRNDSLISK